jgi:DNA-binding response OmpR family regulator
MMRQLSAAGWAAEQASPGFAAGAALARFDPDVVVLAASGPDGGPPLSELRADRESGAVPVVAVGQAEWCPGLVEAGCAAALPRPLADGALAGAAERALRERAPRRNGARAPR